MTTDNPSPLRPTYDMVLDGLRGIRSAHDSLETGKVGNLRAGNTGVVLADGTVVGKCARLTYLRLIGIDAGDDDASRELMFGAGTSNEDRWHDMLVQGGFPASRIKRETEVPISWRLKSGRLVTGRPDMVLYDRDPTPTLQEPPPARLIELKLVSALWTGRDVLVRSTPKTMHLMQAGHYAWQLGCPGELWYTNRTDFAIPFGKEWPAPGEPNAEYFQYNNYGKPMKLLPFLVGFELQWRGGDLYYRRIASGQDVLPGLWVKSIVTKQGIVDYYEAVDAMTVEGVEALPPRPVNLVPDGSSAGYNACDYCALSQVCDKGEKAGKTAWVAASKEWLALTPATGSVRLGE